jgi:glucose/arabinose dehydrogenase
VQLEPRILLAGDAVGVAIDRPAEVASAPGATAPTVQALLAAPANLVFISPDTPDLDIVLAGLEAGHQWILIDPARDGLEQIGEQLASRRNVASVHLIAHASEGELLLAGQPINSAALDRYHGQLQGWSQSLAPGADILLYGCNLAAGSEGQRFVQRLAEITGADVAASTDRTGDRAQGGDWDLEFTTGLVQASPALIATARAQYVGILPITIRAAGVSNEEQMLLQIGGTTVATFNNIGGNAYGGVFQNYTYNADGVSADAVRIVFTNDLYNPATGQDRNLRVDHITIDGVIHETEHPSVFSTGTWLPADGIVPGFRQNEYLHGNGYFQYAELDPVEPGDGSVIEVRANGMEGPETMQLQIDGVTVQTWSSIGTAPRTFSYTAADTVTASQIRVAFTNDLWNPSAGIDNNLVVDWIKIDGQTFETEHPSVFSTGSWLAADGIVPGYRQSEILNANGYFQYDDPAPPPPPGDGSVIVVHARGFEGDENMVLQIGGTTVASWNGIGTQQRTFSHTAATTVTGSQVRVWFTNDLWNPGAGIDRNLLVDRITIDGVDFQTEDPSVYSTGSWLAADGIVPGYRQSEILNTNGYFQYADAAVIPNGTGFRKELIASGLVQPVAFAEAPDGRIFVNEKAGRVRVIQNGQLLPTPFLDINLEVNSHHDRGLIGIALDPNFAVNRYVYLQYAVELDPANPDKPDFNTPAAGQLIRVTASASNPNVADPASRVVIQSGHQMTHATHAVGEIDFDNQGNLIFTWGDGGFDNNLRLAAQNPDSVQGKLFRINPVTFQGVPGNPYYDPANPSSIRSRVWAVGVRNSWKMTVDRATGDVYMGEVTDSGPEEINVMRADGSTVRNFGWPYYEDTNRTPYGTVPANFVYEPAFVALPHTDLGGGDAIVGGAMFRGDAYPDVYDGRYFFGNFNQGILYTADQDGNYQQFGEAGDFFGLVHAELGSDGHIWVMSLMTGKIERLVYESNGSDNTRPVAIATATKTAGASPVVVTLDASASRDDDGDSLTFAWDFQSDGIVDASGPIATRSYTTTGRSVTTLTVSDGRGGSDTQLIEIDVLASAPADGNLALGRPAVSSAPYGAAIASRAVDGNTNGQLAGNSVAQTVQTRTPLWEVDLGAVYDIGSIDIFTRSDGNPLSNFWILISENPFSSGNLDAAKNDPGVWLYHDTGTAGLFESIAVGTLGRYVRIQMEGVDDILALAEVRVIEAV